MEKTRYTVKVDDKQLDVVRAWGTLSAACMAMESLLGIPSQAARVTVISGPGIIRYRKKD